MCKQTERSQGQLDVRVDREKERKQVGQDRKRRKEEKGGERNLHEIITKGHGSYNRTV